MTSSPAGSWRHGWLRLLPVAFVALAAASCSILRSGWVVPDDQMVLSAGNQTDRSLKLFVDGVEVRELAPLSDATVAAAALPALPWRAELRLPTGRSLLELTVESGSVNQRANGSESVAARLDLSCGRIEIWSGAPLLGPAPGQGSPGDCDP